MDPQLQSQQKALQGRNSQKLQDLEDLINPANGTWSCFMCHSQIEFHVPLAAPNSPLTSKLTKVDVNELSEKAIRPKHLTL